MPCTEKRARLLLERGSYRRTRLNRFGFPRGYLMRRKQVRGFQTGDLSRPSELRDPRSQFLSPLKERVSLRGFR
jgi:hypothetical protein